MDTGISSVDRNRRKFFSKILPAGTLCCMGCSSCFAAARSENATEKSSKKHKFLEDSGMTFKDVYNFAYKQGYIPIMQVLAHEMGKDAFIEMLKKAGAEFGAQHGKMLAKHFPKNDLAAFIAFMKREDRVSQHVWTFETIEETDITFEIKVTECLWADTFREADASNIGYATYCHADYAMAQAFNPKMKMIRTKTLMEGHDCCNHRYVMEE